MSHKTSSSGYLLVTICLIAVVLSACAPVATREPQPIPEPATPTPEIFSALAPSPTPADSTLPLTCQVTDLGVYINEEWGYCLAYPGTFTLDESRAAEGVIALYGPNLDDSANPVRVSLEITGQAVPEGGNLSGLVEAYLTSFRELSGTIMREPGLLGSVPAEILEPVPGLLSSRVVMALRHETLFTLRFHPWDLEMAKADLEALTQTVTGSFAFLPQAAPPASELKSVSWSEFGQDISLIYDSILAPWVDAWTVPALPVNDQIMFAEAHPTYAQIRFLGFQGGRAYDLPLLPLEDPIAQVRIFQTAEFPGFGDESSQGFVNQFQALKDLLQSGVDPARCSQPLTGRPGLPYLPWINMQQTFCAQPQILEFPGGKGVRYLTHYSQGPSPVLDRHVFYTFQGLTDDEQFYVAAFFPVQTGIFPTESPACSLCGDSSYYALPKWTVLLADQLTQLNAQPEEDFGPSLRLLDDLIKSIHIGD